MHATKLVAWFAWIFAGALAATGTAAGQTITEFAIPTANSGPAQIAPGPDGALWFTEDQANRIGRITAEGAITEFELPEPPGFLQGITAGPDGAIWFIAGDRIGRITPVGEITEYPAPGAPWGIAAGSDGALWFTEYRGLKIGRLALDGEVREFPVPNSSPFDSLRAITNGPDGALWFRGQEELGRITTSGEITRFPVGLFSDGIASGPDGALWFPTCGLFPRIRCQMNRRTLEGALTRFPIGSGVNGFNVGITSGPDDAIWFTERYGNSLGRVTLDGVVSHFPIPTADGFPWGIAAGPDGTLWFTEHDANKIARLSLPTSCPPDRLCLQGDRFHVGVTWTKRDGSSGVGHPVGLSDQSGYFWFLEPGNVEVVTKVLNGCGVNGHVWFFAGGLTNLEVVVTVTDTTTGDTKEYSNPQGTAFQPITDTTSLKGCPAGGEALANPDEPAESLSAVIPTVAVGDSPAGCANSDTILCVSGRFQVEATWQTASGRTGPAHAVGLTGESGYFWFFDKSNVELVVKVLDACGIGYSNWFFAGGMTTVGVQIQVTDRLTGAVRTYTSAAGIPFAPIQDVGGFPCQSTPTGSVVMYAVGSDGALVQAADGSLYGTTVAGGTGLGTIFRIDPLGFRTTLHAFSGPDGATPDAGLILASDGYFYGTTSQGGIGDCHDNGDGCGTVFKMDTSGNLTTLHFFTGADGSQPHSSLLEASDGSFYGTTFLGGGGCPNAEEVGCGTVFRIDKSGTLTTLLAFGSSGPAFPWAGLIQGSDGYLYGMSGTGVPGQGYGFVFRLDTSGNLTRLHTFSEAEGYPSFAGVIEGNDGGFYGTTQFGGAANGGTVFRIDASGSLTTLHSFSGPDGASPQGSLVQASDGFFYGTTSGGGNHNCPPPTRFHGGGQCGTVFRVDAAGNFTTLHLFNGSDGGNPTAPLIQGLDGKLYGTTSGVANDTPVSFGVDASPR